MELLTKSTLVESQITLQLLPSSWEWSWNWRSQQLRESPSRLTSWPGRDGFDGEGHAAALGFPTSSRRVIKCLVSLERLTELKTTSEIWKMQDRNFYHSHLTLKHDRCRMRENCKLNEVVTNVIAPDLDVVLEHISTAISTVIPNWSIHRICESFQTQTGIRKKFPHTTYVRT